MTIRIRVNSADPHWPLLVADQLNGDSIEVALWESRVDGVPLVQIDTVGLDATFRVNVNDGELATVQRSGEAITLPEHAHESFTVRPAGDLDEELCLADRALGKAEERYERAVLRKVSRLIKDAYPDAAWIEYDGVTNEVGLLHTYLRRIYDADGRLLADIDEEFDEDDPGLLDDAFAEVADRVDSLMWGVSERDQNYAGDDNRLDLLAD